MLKKKVEKSMKSIASMKSIKGHLEKFKLHTLGTCPKIKYQPYKAGILFLRGSLGSVFEAIFVEKFNSTKRYSY